MQSRTLKTLAVTAGLGLALPTAPALAAGDEAGTTTQGAAQDAQGAAEGAARDAQGAAQGAARDAQGAAQDAQDAARGSTSSSSMESAAQQNPQDLDGKNVTDGTGQEIGAIESIMRSRENGDLYAVISADDFLGLGGDDVAVPLSELQLGADDTVVMSQTTKDELKGRIFNKDDFVEYDPQSENMRDGGSSSETQTQGGANTP